jgi:APA family basic amino acid/polyamine antiporter
MTEGSTRRMLGLGTTTGLVVASMIGTGVYTATGALLEAPGRSPLGVLAIWLVAGLLSLAGALSYAELASVYPESGGEYALLTRLYHPAVGFVGGIVSLVLGFAAPIAACAIALVRYGAAALGLHAPPFAIEAPLALVVIALSSLLHVRDAAASVRAQDLLTLGKMALAVLFAGVGLAMPAIDPARLASPPLAPAELAQPSFALGVVIVSFAYTGWNAAVYVGGEVRDAPRTLPRALGLGTLAVTLLYLALNVLFLLAAPHDELVGVVEVAHVAATHLFGALAGRALSSVIAFGLLSTIGAFVLTGARVYEALGRDHAALAPIAGRPRALFVQVLLAAVMVLTSSFDMLLGAVGITLTLSSALTVVGVFVVRRRGLRAAYRTPGHPITPIAFVALSGWTIVSAAIADPSVTVWGALAVGAGLLLYVFARRRGART